MSPMPFKVIGREVCLQAKGPFRLSKDPGPQICPIILWRKESKEIKDFMKVKDGRVYCKRYDGYYTKQQIKISRAI